MIELKEGCCEIQGSLRTFVITKETYKDILDITQGDLNYSIINMSSCNRKYYPYFMYIIYIKNINLYNNIIDIVYKNDLLDGLSDIKSFFKDFVIYNVKTDGKLYYMDCIVNVKVL